MNLRCGFCQTPYALGRTEMLAALQHLESENLTHYDAHCPRCRRATPVLRRQLELALPNWKEELKEAVNQPQPAVPGGAPAPVPQPAHVTAAPKPAPVQATQKAQPSAKPAAAKATVKPAAKPAAKKPAAKAPVKAAKAPVSKKTQAKKPAATKSAGKAPAKKKGK